MWVFFPQDVAKNYISKYKEGSAKQTDVVLFAQHNKRQLRSLEARLPPSYAKEIKGGINHGILSKPKTLYYSPYQSYD